MEPLRRVQCDPLQLSVDAPRSWVAKGALVLVAPGRPGSYAAPTFTARNELVRAGESLPAHAEARRVVLARRAAGLEVLEEFSTILGGCDAVCLHFAWDSPFGRAEQTLAFVEREIERTHVRTTFAATTPLDEAPRVRERFAAMLDSVRFGSACYAPPPRLSPPPIRP